MDTAHHLKIKLKNAQPVISRELLVPSDLRLDRLHDVLQIAMGWEDCHMHEFNNGARGPKAVSFGPTAPDFFGELMDGSGDENKATLADLAPAKGDKFVYWYDFGDDWFHLISVHAVKALEPGTRLPVCLKGVGACPPEDCGGPWGYAMMLEALRDPTHPEHEELSEWVGDDWDPQHYDMDAVNKTLARLGARWRRKPRKSKSP